MVKNRTRTQPILLATDASFGKHGCCIGGVTNTGECYHLWFPHSECHDNNLGEMMAVLLGWKLFRPEEIVLDSFYAYNLSMKEDAPTFLSERFVATMEKNCLMDAFFELRELLADGVVRITHVKSHADTELNNKADALVYRARQAYNKGKSHEEVDEQLRRTGWMNHLQAKGTTKISHQTESLDIVSKIV